MRAAFAITLAELAARDRRILLLTGDLGYMALEPFAEKFPDRFFNMGVAEQNMVGVATGLSEAGYLPFLYTIATFASLRPFEFIRNGPIHHRLPVRIVGVGGGFEYGHAGATHYGLEDVGVMRTQPGLTLIAPADYRQMRTALLATWDLDGPIYYRIGKDDRTEVSGLDGRFRLGRAEVVREGEDLLLITMGSISSETVAAAEQLTRQGINSTVMLISSLSPEPTDDLAQALARFPVALTIEAHYVNGGIGSLVSEIVAERGLGCRIVRCGVRSVPDGFTGSQDYLHRRHGLSREAIVETALSALRVREVVR